MGAAAGLLNIRTWHRNRKVNKENMLDDGGDKKFEYYEDEQSKLNSKENEADNNLDEEKREEFIDKFIEVFGEYQDNIFYDEIIYNDDFIGDLFNSIKENDILTEANTVEIFKKYNSYIILKDHKIKENLQELMVVANRVYREIHINDVKEKYKNKK